MSKPNSPRIEIFRVGTHVSDDGRTMTFSEADVAEIAETYDPAVFEAPLVVGHPKTDHPAYGWAESLAYENGLLYATPHQVDPQFAEMNKAGRYKKISSKIYLPGSPGNPTPGKHYLQHVGFLGGAAPAVKGLRPVSFSEDDGAVSFSMPISDRRWGFGAAASMLRRLRDHLIETAGLETADKVLPSWELDDLRQAAQPEPDEAKGLVAAGFAAGITEPTPNEDTNVTDKSKTEPPQFAEREQQLNTQAADLAAREKTIADREAKARRDDAVAFAENLASAEVGKLLPRQVAPVVELLLALPADAAVSFAEGDQTISKPGAQVLRELLSGMPKQIDYSEKSPSGAAPAAASFAAPAGVQVDAGRAELYSRAKAYQAQHPDTTIAAAVAAVGG